jgi:excisionase family DNA binding protein
VPDGRRFDRGFDLRSTDASRGERKMIMGKKSIERLMTLPELSEMLGIPIETLYGWRHRGEGPVGYRIGRHVRYRRAAVEEWLEMQADRRDQIGGWWDRGVHRTPQA